MRAACVPTTPPPSTTTLAGGGVVGTHAAEEQPLAAGGLAQREGGGLDGQPAGHFAHRREQRQAAALVGDRLVGHRGAARLEQAVRLLGIGREVKVGEEDLPLAQLLPLDRLRLLDLDDQLGAGEHLVGARNDAPTRRGVGRVAGADAGAGPGLHENLVSAGDVLAHRHRREADAMLLDLDLLRYADTHPGLHWGVAHCHNIQSRKRAAGFSFVRPAVLPSFAPHIHTGCRCQALGRVNDWIP
jgi:hypothetical protein